MTKLNWRDASKELPKHDKDVLIYHKFGSDYSVMIAKYDEIDKKWFAEVATSDEITAKTWFFKEIDFQILKWSELPLPEELL